MHLVYMLTGFAISLISVPIITSFAVKAHIVDVPCERKIHIDNIPLLGGLGIFVSYAVILLLIGSFTTTTYALLGANLAIVMTGILDDVKSISPVKKLLGQFTAATVIVLVTDFRFTIDSFNIALFSHPFVAIVLTYLWIIGATNALNLIDGMDGLAGGISFMAFGAMGYAAFSKGLDFNAYICMGLMGATLGFLRYNTPPAKVFMGDTGSLFLGFNIAVMSIATFHKSATILSVLLPVMFISLPLFDTVLAIIRRTMKGQNPMAADKEHLHHRLLSLEFSSAQTLMIFYSLSILLIVISLLSLNASFLWGAILVLLLLYMFLIILKLSHTYDVASKIRLLNTKLRKAADIISEKNVDFSIKTRMLDAFTAILTLLFLGKYLISFQAIQKCEIFILIIFCISLVAILTYKKISQINNQFVSFGFFWILFYSVFHSYMYGLTLFDKVIIIALSASILVRALMRKRIDVFLSNPLELLMFFCMFLIYMFTNTPAGDFFTISMCSFALYYANKFFFANKCKANSAYIAIVLAVAILFTFKSIGITYF